MHIRIWETDRLKTFMRRRLSSCTLRCATNKTKICRSHNVDSDLASVNGICVCKSNESRKSSSTISIINRPSDCSLVLQIRRHRAYTSAIGRQEADDESDGSELPRSSGGSPHELRGAANRIIRPERVCRCPAPGECCGQHQA